MKRLITFFAVLYVTIALLGFVYEDQRTQQVNYIVQNPKFFPNSIGYFRISGMKDKDLQKRTNDTLLKWYSRPTGFYKPTGKISNRLAHLSLNKDEKLWIYRQMCQINNDSLEGIIFKNNDSIKVLGPTGYKGSGQSICTWGSTIYRNRILCISMEYSPKNPADKFENPLLLDLKTLKRAQLTATIKFPENKKDSLQDFMKAQIEKEFIERYGYRSAQASPVMQDSIVLSMWQILGYLYNENLDTDLYLPYTMDGTTKAGEKTHLYQSFKFSLKELSPYSDGEYINEIDSYFN